MPKCRTPPDQVRVRQRQTRPAQPPRHTQHHRSARHRPHDPSDTQRHPEAETPLALPQLSHLQPQRCTATRPTALTNQRMHQRSITTTRQPLPPFQQQRVLNEEMRHTRRHQQAHGPDHQHSAHASQGRPPAREHRLVELRSCRGFGVGGLCLGCGVVVFCGVWWVGFGVCVSTCVGVSYVWVRVVVW